jgi:hypothetical protein
LRSSFAAGAAGRLNPKLTGASEGGAANTSSASQQAAGQSAGQGVERADSNTALCGTLASLRHKLRILQGCGDRFIVEWINAALLQAFQQARRIFHHSGARADACRSAARTRQ